MENKFVYIESGGKLPEMKTIPNVGAAVQITEFERGYGQRSAGYMVFFNREDAERFIKEDNESRTSEVPETYWKYKYIGACKISMVEVSVMIDSGRDPAYAFVNKIELL